MPHRTPDYIIGIDIGGTRIKAAAVDRDGRVLEEADRATGDPDPNWPDNVRALCEQLEAHQGAPASAVGLAAPGLAHPDRQCIAWMPERLPGIEGLVWADRLQRTHPVPVLNDGHAALLGEVWQGAAAGCRDVVLMTLGTGVGGAILSGGRLLLGRIGRAGVLGHISLDVDGEPDICNVPGSIEDAIGECTLEKRSAGRFTSTRELVAACERGDEQAREVWERSLKKLGGAVASIINIADPEVVLIGGGMAKAGDALLRPLHEHLDEFEWRPGGHRVEIRLTKMGDRAGALGAAYYALHGGRLT